MSVRRRARSALRRGLTLIELMVGVFIGVFLTAAAVAFATHETRLLGYSNEKLDLVQSSRAAMDLLVQDVRMAGAGVGYTSTGMFGGLLVGNFGVAQVDGSTFPFNDAAASPVNLIVGQQGPVVPYAIPTMDLGIAFADGGYATITDFTGIGGPGAVQFCNAPENTFRPNEMVLLRSEDGITARSAILAAPAAANCLPPSQCGVPPASLGACMGTAWSFDAPALFQTDLAATTNDYLGGEVMGGFRTIVWFVDEDPNGADYTRAGTAQLHRAVFDGSPGSLCTAGNRATCGAIVSDGVETMLYRVYQFNPGAAPPRWEPFDPGANGWADPVSGAPLLPVNTGLNTRSNAPFTDNRLRIDLEVVFRARIVDARMHSMVPLRLAPGVCVPGPAACPPPTSAAELLDPRDFVERRVIRTSVEIKNSGRMASR